MLRKELKKRAKGVLKKHYLLLVAVCLIAAFIGAEFSSSLSALSAEDAQTAGNTAASGNTAGVNKGLTKLFQELIDGTIIAERLESTPEENAFFGTSRGVFASIINAVTSGSFLVTAFAAVNSVVHSKSAALILLILIAFAAMFALWFFVQNLYTAISRRVFLEARLYEKVPVQRFLFFMRVKRWARAASAMFVATAFQLLWSLTVIGGFIKHYSYFLVPYLVAENPDLKPLEAISLSRRMMNGHKKECFLFELSFLGWSILGFATFGLSEVLFSNPYKLASFSEYYAIRRAEAIDKGIAGNESLNDRWLFQKPGREDLRTAYSDVLELMEKPAAAVGELPGFRGFLAKNFGVVLRNTPEEQAYEKSQAEQVLIDARRNAVEGTVYPDRMFTIPETEKRERAETVHYLRRYSVWSLLLMFFLFSFVGWVWEVSLHLVVEHELVNRGMLYGPWLPIYGSGGILILVLLNRLRKKPALEFLAAVVLCGIVEYSTSYVTELIHDGQRWWDYSGYFINLNGRICGEGLLVFGLGGMLVVYLLAPQLDNLIRRIPGKVLVPLCLVLAVLFVSDQAYSAKRPNAGKGITEGKGAGTARLIPAFHWNLAELGQGSARLTEHK